MRTESTLGVCTNHIHARFNGVCAAFLPITLPLLAAAVGHGNGHAIVTMAVFCYYKYEVLQQRFVQR
jgi:hypothetical protein